MGAKIPSEFVPLDVLYPHDRAIRSAGHCAELLFIRGLAYARKNKTNGSIPDYDLAVVGVGIPAVARHAKSLVREELWTEVDGGWCIRSWEKWNPDQERREKQSVGGIRGNHTKWHTGPKGQVSEDCTYCFPISEGSVPESVPDHYDRSLVIAEREREGEKRGREGRSAGDADASAQTLVAEWIDHCDTRPPGRVIGQLSKEVKTLLDEGIPYDRVRRGLAVWHDKGLHPSTLASVVHETSKTPKRGTTDQRVQDALDLSARLRAEETTPQIGA